MNVLLWMHSVMVAMQKGFQCFLFGDIGTRGMLAFMVRSFATVHAGLMN